MIRRDSSAVRRILARPVKFRWSRRMQLGRITVAEDDGMCFLAKQKVVDERAPTDSTLGRPRLQQRTERRRSNGADQWPLNDPRRAFARG